MTARRFDPVFSAALRNELEALADAPEREASTPGLLDALRRPQVWISVVTAIVLVAATVGVLQLTRPTDSPPAGRSKVVDPLAWVTDPSSPGYVARAVQVLIHVGATGAGAHEFDVPAGVTSLRVYLNCAPTGASAVDIDGEGRMSGECSRNSGSTFDMPVKAGSHEVEVTVKRGTDYTLLVMASPAPTVSTGALLDPLTAIRDRRNPDALTGDTTPLLNVSDVGVGAVSSIPVTPGKRLRAYFVCDSSSPAPDLLVAGHRVTGCMNSVAHWFDFTTGMSRIDASVTAPAATRWAVLVVPAPTGAKDSPANTTLAYPEVQGPVLARARGTGAPAAGTYRDRKGYVAVTTTCSGTGWLEVRFGGSGTSTRGNACSTSRPSTTGFGGDSTTTSGTLPWSVIPHGDISWTFQLVVDD